MRRAIIDIGYNAIRSVVYESEEIGAPEIFNKKFKNDILSILAHDDFDIKHPTYLSIQYLLHVFKKLGVTDITCVATAVLRDHPKANSFVNFIKNKYDFEIEIISGKREAYLMAIGLMTGINHSNGLAIDLGGGSLELVEVLANKVGKLQSLNLGTKVLSNQNIKNEESVIKIIKEQYGDRQYNNLYFVGGALRFIARIYIDFMSYSLSNLHNLEIAVKDFVYYLDELHHSLDNPYWKKKVNQNAILIARAVIKVFNPENIIISTYGLKEGVRFELLNHEIGNKDIVIEKVKYTCNYNERNTDFDSYINAVNDLLPKKEDISLIIRLSIILLELKPKFDKTLPPFAISEFILSAEIPFTLKDRVKLALILSHSSGHKPSQELIGIAKKFISKEERSNCQIIGIFLCIAEEIDGPVFSKPTFHIKNNNNFLEIISKELLPRSVFEKVCYHLKSIAYLRKIN